jgi:hypothetical protein
VNFHTILHDRHSGPTSLAGPDTTPRPSPVSPAAQRASEAPCSSVYVNARFTDEDKTREARVLDRLAALTRGTGGMASLAAAQALFASELRKDHRNA